MTNEEKFNVAELIRYAFFEGYNSYSTPASAYNTVDGAWQDSEAKLTYDLLIADANKK